MAEFTEVMKKRQEMHDYYITRLQCKKCPLIGSNTGHAGLACDDFFEKYPEEAEQIIMAWEKPVDWSKVEVDTKILVRDLECEEWQPRHFAKYDNGKVYTFLSGKTSWTVSEVLGEKTLPWRCAKLAEVEE